MVAPTSSNSSQEPAATSGYATYDAAYEWPGLEDAQEYLDCSLEEVRGTTATSFFRLVVIESSILPSKHRIAILTGYPEIQFGRDKPPSNSSVPRIRLKEMEVSKIHATVYWDGLKKEWAVVDMGSKHGTFLLSDDEGAGSGAARNRLSPPRVASLPRTLHHLDRFTIASTTFVVHLHADDIACIKCSSGNEIPLFSAPPKASSKSTSEVSLDASSSKRTAQDPKKSLAMLKQSLLRQHSSGSAGSPSDLPSYIDRAARRRRMHGLAHSGAPGVQVLPIQAVPPPPKVFPRPSEHIVSEPARPLPTNNIGHRLLTKMGWEEGRSLGLSLNGNEENGDGIVEPIQVTNNQNRAGLGVKRPAPSCPELASNNWWEAEKHKRFAAMRAIGGESTFGE